MFSHTHEGMLKGALVFSYTHEGVFKEKGVYWVYHVIHDNMNSPFPLLR